MHYTKKKHTKIDQRDVGLGHYKRVRKTYFPSDWGPIDWLAVVIVADVDVNFVFRWRSRKTSNNQ